MSLPSLFAIFARRRRFTLWSFPGHVASFFDHNEDEAAAIERRIGPSGWIFLERDPSVEGFNIGEVARHPDARMTPIGAP
jgi:hypothetical protein